MDKKVYISKKDVHEKLKEQSKQLKRETKLRIKAEKLYKALLGEYEVLADNQPSLIWKSGIDKLCTYFNKVWLDFTGRTLEQELGNGWTEGVHPDDFNECLKIYTDAFDLRQEFTMEYRLRKADGSYAWVLDHGVPRYSSDGVFQGYIGTCVDTTQSKDMAETLRVKDERYYSYLEASNDAVMILADNKFIYCNSQALRLFKCERRSDLLACHPADLSPPIQQNGRSSVSSANEKVERALKEGVSEFYWIHRKMNGDEFPAQVTLTAMDLSGRKVLQGIVRDLTYVKRSEDQIARRDISLRLIKEVSDLLATVSSLDDAIIKVLQLVCEIINYPVGHAYCLDTFDIVSCEFKALTSEGSGKFASTNMWHISNPGMRQSIERLYDEVLIADGVGLAGRVLFTGKPEGIIDVSKSPYYLNAERTGIRGGVAFPVLIENTTVLIFEFYSTREFEHDNNLIESFVFIGSELFRLIKRIQRESQLRTLNELERLYSFVSESQQRLNSVINSVAEGIIIINEQGIIDLFNPSSEKLFGYASEEVLGKNISMLMPEPHRRQHDGYIQSYMNTGKAKIIGIGREVEGIRKDGSCFPLYLSIRKFNHGEMTYFLGSVRDLTEQNDFVSEILRLRSVLKLENEYLRSEVLPVNELVGESPLMREIIGQIRLVADSSSSVLILGETGVGKELVAQSIHQQSQRRNNLLVKVNCGGIPHDLFESEFFGHVKGAFTGAYQDRVGRFELADKGTIFLDEIAELSLPLQTKLLRVIQEREFERVGETKIRKIDVRIIAATNRNLMEEVNAGRFRADLYYRLNVFPIAIPPLRERLEDIGPIACDQIKKICQKLNYREVQLSPIVIDRLKQYAWPGNVRELQHVLERSVLMTHNGQFAIDVKSIDAVLGFSGTNLGSAEMDSPITPKFNAVYSSPNLAHKASHPSAPTAIYTEDMEQHDIAEYRRQNILAALEKTNWKISGPRGASELLRMKATTLISRMKKLGIKKPT